MTTKTYTIEECLKHCDDKDCWLIIDGKVYDVTPFLDEHPGGFDTMVSNSGECAESRCRPRPRPQPPSPCRRRRQVTTCLCLPPVCRQGCHRGV